MPLTRALLVAAGGSGTVIAPVASLLGTSLDSLGRDVRLILFDPRGRG